MGLRPFPAPLAGEKAAVPPLVDDRESGCDGDDDDDVRFAPENVFMGVAFDTCTSAVDTARTGVQLESPRKSIRDIVALYWNVA